MLQEKINLSIDDRIARVGVNRRMNENETHL